MTRRISPELRAAGLLLAAFVLLALWVSHHLFPGELRTYLWALVHHNYQTPRGVIEGTLGYLGTWPAAVVTVAVAGAVVARNVGPRAVVGYLVATAVVAPAELIQYRSAVGSSVGIAGENFPSVHVVYATASWGFLAMLGARHRRPEVAAIFAGLIVAMGVFRITSAAHFISDVIGGYLLGGAWLLLVLSLARGSWPARG